MADLTLIFNPRREGICVLGMGDCGSKTEARTTVTTDITNKTVSNYLSSKASSASAQATNINDMNVKISKIGGGCDITLGQKIDSKVKALASIDSTDTKTIRDKVKTDLKAQVDQAAASKGGMFATTSNSAKTSADYKTKIDNIVETNMTDSQQVTAFASVYNKNNMTLDLGECSGDAINRAKINASQNIASDLEAAAMLKNVSTAIQEYEKSNSATTETKQASTATAGGLEDVIKAFMEGKAIIALLILCCCCCCCLLLLGGGAAAASGGVPAAPSS
jgi:hypothetical protein